MSGAPADAGAEQSVGRELHSPQATEQKVQGSTTPAQMLGRVWLAGATVKA